MKVTVWRPREANGLGSPQGVVGDDQPEGDWVKGSEGNFDRDGYQPLHMLGRDFLIYSMYHVREPRFIGYAVENFGAACEALGFKLPLTEDDACWLTYPKEELDPGRPDEYRMMLGHIATVFGKDAATQQADALGIQWPAKASRKSDGRGR